MNRAFTFVVVFRLLQSIVIGFEPESRPATTSAIALRDQFADDLKVPLRGESTPLERKDSSAHITFGKKTAALFENTLGIKIRFSHFAYIAYSLGPPAPDSWVSFYAFEFSDAPNLAKLMASIPDKNGTRTGLLRTKAPQRYEIRAIKNVMIALVVEKWQRDPITNELVARFRKLE